MGDHPLVLDGAQSVLEADGDIEVIATATSQDDAMKLVRADAPDVAFIDLAMADDSGLELISDIRHNSVLTGCVVLAASDGADMFREALSRGAQGYVLEGASRGDIRQAVRRVAAGHSYIDPSVSGYLVQATHTGPQHGEPSITAREIDVLRLAAKGLTNVAIAGHLGVKPETVKTYLSRAFERLGATNRASAVAICMRRGLF